MEHPPRKLSKRVIHSLSKWLALQQWKSEGLNLLSAGWEGGGRDRGLLKVMEKCRYSFIIDLESLVIKSKRRECERKQGRYTGYTLLLIWYPASVFVTLITSVIENWLHLPVSTQRRTIRWSTRSRCFNLKFVRNYLFYNSDNAWYFPRALMKERCLF